MKLREALERITNGGDIELAEHGAAVALLSKVHPHSIALRNVARGVPHNCFQFAMGVAQSDTITEILVRDRGRSARGVKFGSTFMRELIDAGVLRPVPNGAVVVYFDGDQPVHAGKVEGGRVVSKWGKGHVWEHELWEVPSSYGNETERYDLAVDLARIERLFVEHNARLPIVGDVA